VVPPGSERRADDEIRAAQQDADAFLARHPRVGRLVSLARAVWSAQSGEQLGLAASGAAFWLVISAFPTGSAVVSLFGLVVSPSQVADDLGALADAAPSSLGSLITEQLQRVASAAPAGLSVRIVVSAALAVWTASAGVYNLDRAIRVSFGLPHQRYVEARGRALAGAFAVVVVLGSLALGGAVVGGHASALTLALVGVPLGLVALTFAIAGLYRLSVGPGMRFRQLLPGAGAAAVAVVVSLAAFAAYLGVSSRFTAVYGGLAGAVIGMIALYFAAYAILLGAVIDVQLNRR
jgi:membrane protein